MRSWTDAQRTAIETGGRSLLVSAAAGSGKTSVLTERIIRRITETAPETGEPRADIGRLLVVTFTKSAATELKERIGDALRERLAANPSSRLIQRQLLRLPGAKISTIHSFCLDLIRRNFAVLGISPTSRIADTGEVLMLKNEAMDATIDDFYDNDPQEGMAIDFSAFADYFVADRDERMTGTLIGLYDRLRQFPGGLDILPAFASAMRAGAGVDFAATVWGKVICADIRGTLGHFLSQYGDAVGYFDSEAVFQKSYLPTFEVEREELERLYRMAGTVGYDELREALTSFPMDRLKPVRAENMTPEAENFKRMRSEFSAERRRILSLVSCDSGEISRSLTCNADFCDTLNAVLRAFEERFDAEKRRRSILDYADLEIFAHRLLRRPDGSLTSAAGETAERFDEIYIDEYQDVNELQDGIFTAISRGDNLFMVGDIKQSIYGFRGAVPELFARYRDAFAVLRPTETNNDRQSTVFLSNNFRCDRTVIDFVNAVFSSLFTTGGRIPYYDEDALVFSKTDCPGDGEPVELIIFDKSSSDEEDDHGEAEYVARRVACMIREGRNPGDIALLFRSVKRHGVEFEQALNAHGVPTVNSIRRSFFDDPAVSLALSLLHTIDNPTKDIYLAATLRSPLFGFTLDELARVRISDDDSIGRSLNEALRDYCEKNDFTKGTFFFKKLSEYRAAATAQPVERLLRYLYEDTALPVIAANSPGGADGLSSLYEYARAYEKGSFRGLYSFLRFLDDLRQRGGETEMPSDLPGDCVRIMTVHQSKGLEFPVCFLCGTGHELSRKDAEGNMLLDRTLGLCLRLRDRGGFARYDTPQRRAAAIAASDASLGEERRVLYVALTRARERLIVTATVRDSENFTSACLAEGEHLSEYSLSRNASYMHWLLAALGNSKMTGDFYRISISPPLHLPSSIIDTSADENIADDDTEKAMWKAKFAERFSFVYPSPLLASLPAKLSVSELYPGILDGDETGETTAGPPVLHSVRFTAERDGAATAADRGTATHIFMQFCDFSINCPFDLATENGIASETERLVREGFIPEATAALIRRDEAAAFFRSPLFSEMRDSRRIWRELRFNCRMPAAAFTEDDEKKNLLGGDFVLVQGVIDCLYIRSDGRVVLLDYKTDRLNLTDRASAAASLAARHRVQLSYYREAVRKLLGKPANRVYLYSFALGEAILLPDGIC